MIQRKKPPITDWMKSPGSALAEIRSFSKTGGSANRADRKFGGVWSNRAPASENAPSATARPKSAVRRK